MSDLIELLPMTRRSFLGSIIALAAAPAIVRASSLMPIQPYNDWKKYVREVVAYRINDDSFMARWDILFPDGRQFFAETDASNYNQLNWNANFDKLTRDSLLINERQAALVILEDKLRHENIAPRSLRNLPLPKGVAWARHLDG